MLDFVAVPSLSPLLSLCFCELQTNFIVLYIFIPYKRFVLNRIFCLNLFFIISIFNAD